ncbi:hypothetical protein BGW36DRAFT_383051 [Talaromyces proteolyticus]|uniref:Uncharacterized protein n=1 Tax=Talaromyces proteolyticus TaxID=1131652 RepID=A0AAD4KNW4_9EURO|nr:uncharacterized protein BGW36DRAFT_383051 [Talaromyces proteolyticus]KAH8695649.1 hypothetical protein BGW36DRAFT_383051 [Talaromyces proteolyticus]
MSKLLSILGLRAAGSFQSLDLTTTTTMIPNYGPAYLMFNFIFAYGILSSRTLKRYYKIDHNVSPREDLTKYGEAAVRDGKLTRRQLEMLKRNEAAHANAVENYTFLVAAIVLATGTGVDHVLINLMSLVYTLARVAYGIFYLLIDDPVWSHLRGISWWVGNMTCFSLLYRSLVALNS